MTFATAYSRPPRVALSDWGPSLTKQSFREECDLKTIMKRYTQSGLLPPGAARTAVYGDFSQVEDYLHALETIDLAETQFKMLPSAARARFRNAPEELLAFIQDPNNKAEAQSLGLLKDEAPTPKPEPTPPTTPPPTSPK